MMSPEEKTAMAFLRLMHDHGGAHVRRLAPSVGPIVWKISRLPGVKWWPRYTRQMGFECGGRHFKGRYSHSGGGRLEIVEVLGNQDGKTVATIGGLDVAMSLDLKAEIDKFTASN